MKTSRNKKKIARSHEAAVASVIENEVYLTELCSILESTGGMVDRADPDSYWGTARCGGGGGYY